MEIRTKLKKSIFCFSPNSPTRLGMGSLSVKKLQLKIFRLCILGAQESIPGLLKRFQIRGQVTFCMTKYTEDCSQ
jgi:hypothetical protein